MSMSTNSNTPTPWVLDRTESTELLIEALGPGVGQRTLGETYDYTLIVRDTISGTQALPSDVIARYNTLLDRARYAGRYTLHSPIDSRPVYTPRWPDGSDSLLVHLEPANPRDATVPGVWGLIDSVGIEQEPMHPDDTTSNVARLTYSVAYLADADEYDSREEITNALRHPGLF